ncbi:M14 family metallopeptidase [Sphingomonas sp. PL-96]|uniref:M14 family metallopeptidase n=1 Tax=Sphingomonas sp. PL-96 TaxID=2887201 RepID=UPI001E5C2418|nr:M14 metallopeptidase family protein [Sphingomonas sp. PL-96]MCC2975912.1 M14 family metallopeptidase [Sphingomonas sp. PL-96]
MIKNTPVVRTVRTLLAASALGLCVPAMAQDVPDPKAVLGHDVGEDYYLANYEDSIRYFQALARASDRIKLFETGKTTHGKTMVYAVISSPENVANFDKYKAISKRLGDPRGLSDEQARQLAKDSPIIVHIDGGMHASEVSDHQLPLALAHKLLSAKNDAEVDGILKNVILVLWPTLNPDGQDIVVDWYRKQRGTQWETSRTPWLYQEYVGHDNNRDGYMLNMKESQVVNATEQEYAPVIWYSQHQVAPFPARIWVPPFADPVSSNISPYMRIWTNAIGTNIMTRMETEGKPGAIAQARFDNWYAGFLDYIHVFRNTISFFTETAHDSATPKTYSLDDFPKQTRDLKAQIMYPHPWRGGEWHLKNSVDYMLTASMSVLETAQKYRDTLLYNRYQAGRDMVAAAAVDGPAAYVIPAGQADMPEAASLAQLMIRHGLDVLQIGAPTALNGQTYAAGSWVVPMDQPFAGLARELLDKQKYPDAVLNGDGQPAELPYDVTGWTLPMQMGVRVDRVEKPIEAAARAAMQKVAAATPPAGGVSGSGSTYLIDRRVNNGYRVLNAALAAGGEARWTTASFQPGAAPQEAIAITGLPRSVMDKIASQHTVAVTASAEAPAGAAVRKGRVALYRPWGSNIDEGWTRWLLEQYAFQPKSLYNADVKAGLSGKYDTIVIPDIGAPQSTRPGDTAPPANFTSKYKGPLASLMDGFSPNQMPAPYSGGIGEDGAEKLKDFVRNGGTLVALNNASDAIIDLFQLPVTNILKDVKSDTFFCSGALLQVSLNPAASVNAGMPADPIVMFERGPAFAPKPGFQGQVLASYTPTGDPLRSGVLLHPEAIQGKAAAVEVQYGKGKVYLYGFRPQWRGQSHGGYKLLFNTLYAGGATN